MMKSIYTAIRSTFNPLSRNDSIHDQLNLLMKRLIVLSLIVVFVTVVMLFFLVDALRYTEFGILVGVLGCLVGYLFGVVKAKDSYTKRYLYENGNVFNWIEPRVVLDADLKSKEMELAGQLEKFIEYVCVHKKDGDGDIIMTILTDSLESAKENIKRKSSNKYTIELVQRIEGLSVCQRRAEPQALYRLSSPSSVKKVATA